MILIIILFGYKFVLVPDSPIIKEDTYSKEDLSYQMPMRSSTPTIRSSQTYKVIDITPILDQPNGSVLRKVQENELLIPEKIEEEYGRFLTEDGISGYIKLEAIQVERVESLTLGISRVDKVIKNTSTYYVLHINGKSETTKYIFYTKCDNLLDKLR